MISKVVCCEASKSVYMWERFKPLDYLISIDKNYAADEDSSLAISYVIIITWQQTTSWQKHDKKKIHVYLFNRVENIVAK